MPVSSYAVSLSTPISIYPTGLQGVLTVRNSDGANTVYLSDVANGNGYPLGPGSAISWDARKPLYAYVVVGFPVTVFTIDNGGGLFDAAAVAAQITASQLASQIGAAMPTSVKQVYGTLVYGTGADGAVTIAGTVTLTRDMNYTTLLVPTGTVLVTAGFKVFASVSITTQGTGKIHNEGGNPSFGGGGIGGLTGTLMGGGVGGAVNGNGAAPPVATYCGGTGGRSGIGTGGIAPFNGYQLFLLDTTVLLTRTMSGGAGGGGGSRTITGGGGGGGGVVVLCSPIIANGGAISANGGDADLTSISTNGGGGGGGVVVLIFTSKTGNPATILGGTACPPVTSSYTPLASRGIETDLAI